MDKGGETESKPDADNSGHAKPNADDPDHTKSNAAMNEVWTPTEG